MGNVAWRAIEAPGPAGADPRPGRAPPPGASHWSLGIDDHLRPAAPPVQACDVRYSCQFIWFDYCARHDVALRVPGAANTVNRRASTRRSTTKLVSDARRLAKELLRGRSEERWRHSRAVAHRASELAITVPETDRPVLVAAAWLHDIGYVKPLRKTGFHPLDGATYLRAKGWSPRCARWSRITPGPGSCPSSVALRR